MKLISTLLSLFTLSITFGQVSISPDPPHPSAIFDLKSTTRGFLMPRMTSFQRTSIGSPAQGLKVYDTDTNTFWYFNGSAWVEQTLTGGGGTSYWSLGSAGSIYNNTAYKFLFGTTELGPGYVNIKPPINVSGLFMSESGTASTDFLSFGIYNGSGTTSTRFGNLLANFGGGFRVATRQMVR